MSPYTTTPYWRLSGFYFFYFASLGVFVPYWGLYLQWQGFSAQEIGELTAIFLGARIIAPNLWAWLADFHGQRMRIVRVTSIIGTIAFSAILLDNSYIWIAVVMLVFSIFWNATLPQFEANTLQHLGNNSHHYSKIRLWGSIGFIFTVTTLGIVFEKISIDLMPIALIITMTGIWIMSLSVPESSDYNLTHKQLPLRDILKQPAIIAFFTVCFLVILSHGPYYTFYSIYLEQNGYSRTLIGQLWALGVLAEVIVFIFMHRFIPRYGLRLILILSLLLSTLRWLLIGLFPNMITVLLFAQLLHAASFGTFHAAAIAWVHQHFVGKNQARGQALYSSIGFGAGGVLGSLTSGYLWDNPGPTFTFILAGISTLLATYIAFKWLNFDK
jgi:PPP family 3-phenylpropionic acid transporter